MADGKSQADEFRMITQSHTLWLSAAEKHVMRGCKGLNFACEPALDVTGGLK